MIRYRIEKSPSTVEDEWEVWTVGDVEDLIVVVPTEKKAEYIVEALEHAQVQAVDDYRSMLKSTFKQAYFTGNMAAVEFIFHIYAEYVSR